MKVCFGSALLAFFFASVSWSQQEVHLKWSEGEHLQLGIEGTLIACRSLGIPDENCPNHHILRDDKQFSFQYGEIVTSADFYNNPNEFMEDKKPSIAKIIKCAYKQKAVQPTQHDEDVNYPSCQTTAVLGMPGYLEVVSQNYNHFGWNNMVAYVEYHGKALSLAKQAFDLRVISPSESRKQFNTALIVNAFADHYLTDAFASGHIRIPRVQLKEWAKSHLHGVLKSTRGDLLAMVLHDTESIDLHTHKEVGLRVQNSRGDVWLTRGDGHLNLFATDDDLAVILPRQALAESFKDLLIASMSGELPEGIYPAADYVPFESDMPLGQKLSPQHQGVKKQSDVVWLMFWALPLSDRILFFKSDFAKMLDHLSDIFLQFRSDIAHDQVVNAELQKRLPNKYLQAYLGVE